MFNGLEDGLLSRLLIPDAITPKQYFEGARNNWDMRPVKRLMLAVLEDGLHCFQTYAGAKRGIKRQIFVETEGWFADRRADGPFAFETICHTLGIDPDFMRKGLRNWRRQQLNGMNPPRLARRAPVRVSGPISVPPRRRRSRRAISGTREIAANGSCPRTLHVNGAGSGSSGTDGAYTGTLETNGAGRHNPKADSAGSRSIESERASNAEAAGANACYFAVVGVAMSLACP